jgi:hypothetical protein
MSNIRHGAKVHCEQFLTELEDLPTGAMESSAELLQRLPFEIREHHDQCAECRAALEDLAETRQALRPMKAALPEPGPWFTSRVMAAINARESEIEEGTNNVWVSIRGLAPRLAAFAALLLVLGGSWAMELRHADKVRQQQMQPADSLFEGSPNTPLNYDIIASVYEEQP